MKVVLRSISLPDKFMDFFHLNYENVRYTIYLDVNDHDDFGDLKIFLYTIIHTL